MLRVFFRFVDVMEPSARPHSYQIQQSRVIVQNGNADWRRNSESAYDLSPTNHGEYFFSVWETSRVDGEVLILTCVFDS